MVGPRLENSATVSSDRSIVLLSLVAPTVMTAGLIPGLAIVPFLGPEFPAATQTTIPFSHALQLLALLDHH